MSGGPTVFDFLSSCFSTCLRTRGAIRLPNSPPLSPAPHPRDDVDALSLHSNFASRPRSRSAGADGDGHRLSRWTLFWSWFFSEGVIRLEDPPSPVTSPVSPVDRRTVKGRGKRRRRTADGASERSEREGEWEEREGEEDRLELPLSLDGFDGLEDEQAYEALYGNGRSIPASPSSPVPPHLSHSQPSDQFLTEKPPSPYPISTDLLSPTVPSGSTSHLLPPTPPSPTQSHDSFVHLPTSTSTQPLEESRNGHGDLLSFAFPVVSEVVRLARERTLERERVEREGGGSPLAPLGDSGGKDAEEGEAEVEVEMDDAEGLFARPKKERRSRRIGPNGTVYSASSNNTKSGSRSSRHSNRSQSMSVSNSRDGGEGAEFALTSPIERSNSLEVPPVEKERERKRRKKHKRSDTVTSASKSTGRSEVSERSERSLKSQEEVNDDFHEGLFDQELAEMAGAAAEHYANGSGGGRVLGEEEEEAGDELGRNETLRQYYSQPEPQPHLYQTEPRFEEYDDLPPLPPSASTTEFSRESYDSHPSAASVDHNGGEGGEGKKKRRKKKKEKSVSERERWYDEPQHAQAERAEGEQDGGEWEGKEDRMAW
ncbi:hypothetical protein BT69DRAFT_1350160 [Atractiella rhizophila]|nr:hypothetical protein BT69DRAFT_1350160 [Atractiella rhizophila]